MEAGIFERYGQFIGDTEGINIRAYKDRITVKSKQTGLLLSTDFSEWSVSLENRPTKLWTLNQN